MQRVVIEHTEIFPVGRCEGPRGVILPDDIANYPRHSWKFMLKLLGAWMAMGFRRPAVDGVP